jgi:tetratricopeptide (TPR) repeat protein
MDLEIIKPLLKDLKNPEEEVRLRATEQLWQIWFRQRGMAGLEAIQYSNSFFKKGQVEKAEIILNQLIEDLPDFAEAWNRRAVLYYSIGEYKKAIKDCQVVVKLNPFHFGAFHGLGLCYAALGQYKEAIHAFRQALEIQPYAIENQRLILECTAKLS